MSGFFFLLKTVFSSHSVSFKAIELMAFILIIENGEEE